MNKTSMSDDTFARGELYLETGKQVGASPEEIIKLSKDETDSFAKIQALAAIVKAGGKKEKEEFIEVIKNTNADETLRIQDLILYIDSMEIAFGLLSWLDNSDSVMRIGSDRQEQMARMSDVAVWTTHLLGVPLPFETTSIKNYSTEEILQTKKALEDLKEN